MFEFNYSVGEIRNSDLGEGIVCLGEESGVRGREVGKSGREMGEKGKGSWGKGEGSGECLPPPTPHPPLSTLMVTALIESLW